MPESRPNAARILAALAGCALGAGAVAAPERYWNNVFGGNFLNSSNWTSPDPGDPTPGSGQYAIFGLGATYTVNLTANRSVNQLMGRIGVVTFNLGGFTLTTNNVWVADIDGGQSQFTLTNGRINSDGGFVGANFATVATLHQTASMIWVMTNDLSVAEFGEGTYNMQPGAIASAFGITVGTGTTGVGTMNIDGDDSRFTASGDIVVGYFGSGKLNITGGADVITPQFVVGSINGSMGEVHVAGAGSTLSGGTSQWNIGNSGDALMTITGGAVVSSATAQLASNPASFSECRISGTGSRWTSSGSFYPARAGEGLMTIEDGGLLQAAASVVIGLDATGSGETYVRTGGTITAGSQLQVGREGFGSLDVLAQSTVTSSGQGSPTFTAGYLGGLAGSTGMMTITGPNARWNANNGAAVIGFGGSGSLTITSAGRLNSVGGFVGRNPGSTGSVTIGGNTSIWNSSGGVNVGLGPSNAPGGVGLVTVNGQGRLFAPVLNVGASGSIAGTGTFEAATTNAGVASPGNDSTPTGTLQIQGTYTQTGTGELAIQIGSSSHDVLSVSGAATLAGDLTVTTIGTVNPPNGQVYEVLNASSITGTFANVQVPELPGGRTLLVSYTPTKVRLTVSAGLAPCPADLDGDRFVGFSDLNIVISNFNTSGPGLPGDVDGDGDVDFADLNAVISVFNTACP